jgi:hypothetical protein
LQVKLLTKNSSYSLYDYGLAFSLATSYWRNWTLKLNDIWQQWLPGQDKIVVVCFEITLHLEN